ncbi:MAG: hypothetical protein ABL949_00535 [Fimbriimonadaceae bacterium]
MQFAIFGLWLAYGILLWRNSRALFAKLRQIPRNRRVLAGSGLLFGSAALLLAVMIGLYQLSPNGISPLAWIIISVAGAGFIHCQVLAAGLFMSMAVTDPNPEPSELEEDTPQ